MAKEIISTTFWPLELHIPLDCRLLIHIICPFCHNSSLPVLFALTVHHSTVSDLLFGLFGVSFSFSAFGFRPLFAPRFWLLSEWVKKRSKFVVDICILYSGVSVTAWLRILLASFYVNCFSPTSPPSISSTPSLLTVNFVCLLPFELCYTHNHHHHHHIHHHH